jgi:hypothetical protein
MQYVSQTWVLWIINLGIIWQWFGFGCKDVHWKVFYFQHIDFPIIIIKFIFNTNLSILRVLQTLLFTSLVFIGKVEI